MKMKLKTVFFIIFVFAIFSRLAFLDLRPLHHDEGVNYFFAKNVINGTYRYNPLNYHGPFYFFLIAFSFLVLGISEFSLRLPAAVFGILIVIFPLIFNWIFGRKVKNSFFASVFLLLSPSLMFFSRYSIHEVSFVFFSVLSVYLFSLIIEKRNLSYMPFLAFSIAMLFAIKETVVVFLFILGVMLIVNFRDVKKIELRKKDFFLLLFSLFLFVFMYVIFFTNLFSYAGIGNSVKAFLPWIKRGIEEPGHQKPFYYYFWLLRYELPVFMLAIVAIIVVISASGFKKIFSRNIVLWFVLSFLIYSFIPYKTPWLVINISVPICILASLGLLEIRPEKARMIILFFTIIYLVFFSFYLNFVIPWQAENDFAYVHTDNDILNLVGKIRNLSDAGKILIVSDEYWPLPFYFDKYKVSYMSSPVNLDEDYDFLIIRDKFFDDLKIQQGYVYKEYRLRKGVNLFLVYRAA